MTDNATRMFWLAFLSAALVLFAFLGSERLPFTAWPELPFDATQMSMDQIILAYAFLPRAAVALLAGAALGLSGALLQAVLRNPIADPSTLGISAGAQLAIVTATLFFPAFLDGNRALVAFIGAGGAAALVFGLGARQNFEPVAMIIAGMLIGITAASLSAALTLSQGEYLMSLATWNGGSLSQQDWSVAATMLLQLLVFASLSAFMLRPLGALEVGDAAAKSLGVPLRFIRFGVAAIAVCLSAMVAAGVGLIGFVGLAAPALARATGARRTGQIVAVAPLIGGLLLWFCDSLVQVLSNASGETFPTGSVMALIGGPMLLVLIARMQSASPPSAAKQAHAPAASRRALPLVCLLLLLAAVISLVLARTGHGWRLLTMAEFQDLLPLRWPRLVAAGAAGGLLAMAGAILQRLTGNPMASPEVLGVSGGAGTGYALALTITPAATALGLLAGAAFGSLAVLVLVLLFALRRHLPPERLLLAGISISALGSAILSALIAIGDQRAWAILAWIGGSASSATPLTASILAGILLTVLLITLGSARWLTILPLGSTVPSALGLPLRGSRLWLILVAAIATGAASMLVGPLSFVGLVAPHIVSRAGFTRARENMLACCLLGAGLMMIADFGARTVTFPYELPLGLFAALIGGPYLVFLVGRRT